MPVPDFQTLMRPMLVLLADGQEQTLTQLRGALAEQFQLTQAEIEELLPSGRQTRLANRVTWAANYLYRCGLLDRPRRSIYRITDRGRALMTANPERVDLSVLAQFPELQEFRRPRRDRVSRETVEAVASPDEAATPEERVTAAYRELRSALAAELRDRVLEQTPEFFEQLVLDVLHAIGYGGRREDVERLGRSGDEGVEGVIREDVLGLDLIYVQAKRWLNPVSRPDIQRFVGALHWTARKQGRLHHHLSLLLGCDRLRGNGLATGHTRRRQRVGAADARSRRRRDASHPFRGEEDRRGLLRVRRSAACVALSLGRGDRTACRCTYEIQSPRLRCFARQLDIDSRGARVPCARQTSAMSERRSKGR